MNKALRAHAHTIALCKPHIYKDDGLWTNHCFRPDVTTKFGAIEAHEHNMHAYRHAARLNRQ